MHVWCSSEFNQNQYIKLFAMRLLKMRERLCRKAEFPQLRDRKKPRAFPARVKVPQVIELCIMRPPNRRHATEMEIPEKQEP